MSQVKQLFQVVLVGFLFSCQACSTAKLWEDADPNARIWMDADKTTEAALKERGLHYQVYNEQGRRDPEGPAQALLRIVEKQPKAVLEALRAS